MLLSLRVQGYQRRGPFDLELLGQRFVVMGKSDGDHILINKGNHLCVGNVTAPICWQPIHPG
jgi:hypothetical protein